MNSLFSKIEVNQKVFDYCKLHGECRELEQLMATTSFLSFWYARDVVGSNFKFGEEVIASDEGIKAIYQKFVESL